VLQDDSDARHVDKAAVLVHDAGLTRRVGPERERDVLAKPQIPGFLHRSRVGAAEQARVVAVVVADLSKYGRQQHDWGDPVVHGALGGSFSVGLQRLIAQVVPEQVTQPALRHGGEVPWFAAILSALGAGKR
jgi:hypothetical protein